MASGTGYEAAVTPSSAPLKTEQRQRLEAVTFARKLVGETHHVGWETVNQWLEIADYIVTGYRK